MRNSQASVNSQHTNKVEKILRLKMSPISPMPTTQPIIMAFQVSEFHSGIKGSEKCSMLVSNSTQEFCQTLGVYS